MNTALRDHLNQDISRKQFLQFMGSALLLMFGLSNFVSLLTGRDPSGVSSFPSGDAIRRVGYGSKTFGDQKDSH